MSDRNRKDDMDLTQSDYDRVVVYEVREDGTQEILSRMKIDNVAPINQAYLVEFTLEDRENGESPHAIAYEEAVRLAC